jgi:nucleotide-binding universal stress UspA family protein
MSTYLVGIDGSDRAHDALRWARSVAGPDDTIVALHAWEVPVVTGYEAAVIVDTSTIEQAAVEFLEHTVADADDHRLTGRLVPGHPGHALVDAADELGPGTNVVVGHAGTGKASLLLGSTANYAIHHTRAPVVVVRGECRLPVRTVAVGVDDSDGTGHDPDAASLAALRWALSLPCVERIEVHHADFVPGVAAGPIVEPGLESDEALAHDERQLRDAITRAIGEDGAGATSAEIVPMVSAGTGAFALIEASRRADLIVIGTHGRRGLVELIRGSTSLEVTAHAHCPVVVTH